MKWQGAIEGDRELLSSTASLSTSTFSRQHRSKDLSILQRDIHLIETRYSSEDTRPHNQLSTPQEQHKGLYSILQGASVTLHTIILRVGCTIYNNHTLEPFK